MCMWRREGRHCTITSRSHITILVHHPCCDRFISRTAKWTKLGPSFSLQKCWFYGSHIFDWVKWLVRGTLTSQKVWRALCLWSRLGNIQTVGSHSQEIVGGGACVGPDSNSRVWTGYRFLKMNYELLLELKHISALFLLTVKQLIWNKFKAVKSWLELTHSSNMILINLIQHFQMLKCQKLIIFIQEELHFYHHCCCFFVINVSGVSHLVW